MKVMTVVGTRPELIRLSQVARRLDRTSGVQHVLVHTGQNYDYELNEIFFEDLGLRRPDHVLGVDTSSLGTVLGGILVAIERIIQDERPDALLVLGDTNSSIAAVMGRRMQVPVYHMEAGNRSFDPNVPEETNRRMVDHVSDFNLVYTEHARTNLLREGLHPRRILKTGSPMREVLAAYRPRIEASTAVEDHGLTAGEFYVVSAHREENVDSPSRLRQLWACLMAVHDRDRRPVLFSTHPRTRRRLDELGDWRGHDGVRLIAPLGFHDYNKLQMSARCTLSDSGTVAEESSLLGFSAVTLRDSIERPEALDTGGILMSGLEPVDLLTCIDAAVRARESTSDATRLLPQDYTIDNTSERVVHFILSTVNRHRFWSGLRSEDDRPSDSSPPERL